MSDTNPAPAQVTPETPATTAETVTQQDTTPAAEPGPDSRSDDTASKAEAPETPEPEKKEESQREQKRRERNRERWARMKEASADAERLRAELYRYRMASHVDLSQVDDPDEALALRTAAKVRESLAGDVEARASQADQAAHRALAENVEATFDDGRERMPDFDQVVTERTPVHPNAVPFLAESERGADILYHLGKNPDVARSLYQTFARDPARALIELGRLEAKISAPAARSVSKAPPPAKIVTGGSNPPAFDPSRASVADMAAEMRKLGLIR